MVKILINEPNTDSKTDSPSWGNLTTLAYKGEDTPPTSSSACHWSHKTNVCRAGQVA